MPRIENEKFTPEVKKAWRRVDALFNSATDDVLGEVCVKEATPYTGIAGRHVSLGPRFAEVDLQADGTSIVRCEGVTVLIHGGLNAAVKRAALFLFTTEGKPMG